MNHEEFHGEDWLDGNKNDIYEDHNNYYGEPTYYSPDDEKVRSEVKYKNSHAKKQYDEIWKIIEANFMKKIELRKE